MGEMADYMLNGDDCQMCGEYLGDGDGFPRSCAACGGDDEDEGEPPRQQKHKKTAKCPECNKMVRDNFGLKQHMLMKHGKAA